MAAAWLLSARLVEAVVCDGNVVELALALALVVVVAVLVFLVC